MATKIRLSRGGKKASPHYSIVVINSTKKQTGKFIEKIGHYHPLEADSSPNRVIMDVERLKYWLGVGAIPTDAIIRFMIKMKVEGVDKFKTKHANPKYVGVSKEQIAEMKKKEKAEAAERKKAKEAAAKAAAEQAATEAAQ